MKQPLANILPVAPTPFHDDGRVDEDGMRRVIDCMIDQGVDAICILANYSEQFLLSDEERTLLMRLSLEHAAGRVPVIVTTSHFSTEIATQRATAAQSMGAAMIMMMPPYRYRTVCCTPRNFRALRSGQQRHFDPDHGTGRAAVGRHPAG